MSDNPQWEIIQGDALKVLSGFAPGVTLSYSKFIPRPFKYCSLS